MVSQAIVAEFCRSGAIEGSIATVKEALRERRDALCAALERELPEARFVPPAGGYFLWVDLPEGTDRSPSWPRRRRSAGVVFVKAPTSCSRAARTPCGSPTRASLRTRSTRAWAGSPRPTGRSPPRPPSARSAPSRARAARVARSAAAATDRRRPRRSRPRCGSGPWRCAVRPRSPPRRRPRPRGAPRGPARRPASLR